MKGRTVAPRPRLLIAGLGDAGLLTAIHLARDFDVVGVSVKPGLVSGQELGTRISRPDTWARDYRIDFGRFRGLDPVVIVHGAVRSLDTDRREVEIRRATGDVVTESYDLLVISTGVTNGFWRTPTLEDDAAVDDGLARAHQRISEAESVAVIGGGAAAISSAANIAARWPATQVNLYHPGDRGLPRHHPRTWRRVLRRLQRLGVGVHPGHRAVVPDEFACDAITTGEVTWSTGQQAIRADAVLWTIGAVVPNTAWLPPDLLDDNGFVRVTPTLQLPGHPDVFAVGDVAATDDLRSSARNRADRLLAHNIRAHVRGRSLRSYRPPTRRWGSVLGVQDDGLEVFTAGGRAFRFPAWSITTILQPWIVRRGIYRGVRVTVRAGDAQGEQ